MGNYTNQKCISCGEIFTDDSDIVVCPECGTPYHRDCYMREGRCINDQLHETGQSWQPELAQSTDDDDDFMEPRRCIRCGYENSAEKLFCEKCGTPLIKVGENSRPFNTADGWNNINDRKEGESSPYPQKLVFDKNSEIEGIKLDYYAKYVGKNPVSFLASFIRFGKFGGKISLNIFAFVFPEVYFLYRKMKPWGIIMLILVTILTIPTAIETLADGSYGFQIDLGIDIKTKSFLMLSVGSSYITLLIKVIAGLFGNYWYYKQAKRDINLIRQNTETEDEIAAEIALKGGTSWAAVIVGLTVQIVIILGIMTGFTMLAR